MGSVFPIAVIQGLLFISVQCYTPLQVESVRGFLVDRAKEATSQNVEQDRLHPLQSFSAINPKYKLNDTFLPENYKLEFTVLLDNDPEIGEQFSVFAKAWIKFKPAQETDEIILHANPGFLSDLSLTVTSTLHFIL